MAEEVSAAVIKATQSSLGKYVKRPPLTEKLLGRPPFKYLHDIFTAVMKSTGFMEGLFTGPEMNPDSFKDRDSKMAYLDKVIRMVGLVNGKEVAVKPSAIVAGKEAEKTNAFLQDLAAAIGKKANNADFVKRVLNGEGPAASTGGSSKKPSREDGGGSKERRKDDKPDEGSRDKKRGRDEGGKDRSRDREKERDKEREKDKDREREKGKDREREKDKDREREKDKEREREKGKDREREKDKDREREKDKEREREKGKERESRDSRGKERDKGRGEKEDDKDRKRGRGDDKDKAGNEGGDGGSGQKGSKDDEGSPNRMQRPSSAKGNRRLRDGRRAPASADSEEEQQRRPRGDAEEPSGGGGRTSSAKPAPLLKTKAGAAVVDDGSGKRVSGVIIERDQDSDDDQFVVEEAPPTLLAGGLGDDGGGGLDDDEEGRDEQHGGLVKEMLKSKQEFKDASGGVKDAGGKTVLTTTDANRKREKAATAREIDRLKQQLQALTREANPLGKVIDYVQEDLDSMSKELERWRAETKEVMARLKQEQGTADVSLNGLRHQLAELEQAERDKLDLIATVKANIVRNDERISKMIEAMSRS